MSTDLDSEGNRAIDFFSSEDEMQQAFQVLMFTISGCPHCQKMKHALIEVDGISSIIGVNLDDHPDRKADMVQRCGKRTVPQLFFNGTYIGNWKIVNQLLESGEIHQVVGKFRGIAPNEDAPMPPGFQSSHTEEDSSNVVIECEPDPDWALVVSIRESISIENIRDGLKVHKRVFRGSNLTALLEQGPPLLPSAPMDTVALEIASRLLTKNMFHHVKGSTKFSKDKLYRFVQDESSKALNMTEVSPCDLRPAIVVAKELRQIIHSLYRDHLHSNGRAVDYVGIANSDLWLIYLKKATELQRVDLDGMTRQESLAFWINLYNCLIIHGNVELGAPKNAMQRTKFFSSVSYQVGGYTWTLTDMEHGVLRANRIPPYSRKPLFDSVNPRNAWCLKYPEPRIHFALVCGAKSCPAIKIFDEYNVEEALTDATISFFDEGGIVSKGGGHFQLSAILKWFSKDFGHSDADVLAWISSFVTDDLRAEIEEVLGNPKKIKLSYQKYDWSQNAVDD